MNEIESIRDRAEEALSQGQYDVAIDAASALIEAGEPWLIDGLFRRALALENWTDGPLNRLSAAAVDWQKLVEIAPCSLAHRYLARVQLKLGDRDSSLANLLEAKRLEHTPEVSLGLAKFYRTASPPNLECAKAYYLHAARHGRTRGMRGYFEVAYDLNQPFLAIAMVLFGLVTTPFLVLFIGNRRHSGF